MGSDIFGAEGIMWILQEKCEEDTGVHSEAARR